MSILVTGGAGFVGARVVRKLVERGEQVVCFDLFPPRANLQPYLHAIDVYRGDVTQMPHLLEAVNTLGVTRVIHLASLLPPDTEERPHHRPLGHHTGGQNVFEVRPGLERAVYASSITCYGLQKTSLGAKSVPVKPLIFPIFAMIAGSPFSEA